MRLTPDLTARQRPLVRGILTGRRGLSAVPSMPSQALPAKNNSSVVNDPARVAAVRSTGLLDTPPEPPFDRLVRLAAKLTGAPATFISLVDDQRDFYKACFGFSEELAASREMRGTTFCHYALTSSGPLVIPDTLADPMYSQVPTVSTLGVRAYLGIPLTLANAQTIGSFCAIDFVARSWSSLDIEMMTELATSTLREIELRGALDEIRRDHGRLRDLSREIDLLLASTYEGICATDLAGRCTLINPSAASMLGYAAHEMEGKVFHDLVHLRDANHPACTAGDCSFVRSAGTCGESRNSREMLRRSDGSSFPADLFISPIVSDDDQARGMVFSFIDVSEREHLQAELERANRMVGLGRVASAMSHEFNNVLMGIQPFAEILLRSGQDPRSRSAAERILQSIGRGRGVTEALRRFTHPVRPLRIPIDAGSFLSESSAELTRSLPSSVRFEVDIAPTPMVVDADREQLIRLLGHLVLNAGEAMEGRPGFVRLMARLTRDPGLLQSHDRFVEFCVTDDGPGIESGNLSRVFEPFYTTRNSGRGLGLPMAQQIANLHDGHIVLESDRKTGTTVRLFLPQSKRQVETPKAPQRSLPVAGRWPREILLVEDDESIAIGVVTLLEDANVKVHLAIDRATALKILHDQKPQALVIDIHLPDCDGFELYDQITTLFGPLPVVFASGHADAARLGTLQRPDLARLLTKPYDTDTLLELLDSMRPTAA